MKKQSPIYVEDVRFCAYALSDSVSTRADLFQLIYDRSHDFLIDDSFGGIAVKIELCNARHFTATNRGIRRTISLTLIDATLRCEVARTRIRVNIPKDDPYRTFYTTFAASAVSYQSGHTYKLVVSDEGGSAIIDERTFHTFSQQVLGHPTDWYNLESGGVAPYRTASLYRSVRVNADTLLNIRFNLSHNFGRSLPMILPELELRLYFPDGDRVVTRFVEPQCIDFGTNIYFVELSFMTGDLYHGAFYAEILCMQYLLGGFVFGTSGPEVEDVWYGEGLKPLDEYSPEKATTRLGLLLPPDSSTEDEDAVFEEALNRFIIPDLDEDGDEAEEKDDAEPEGHPQKADSCLLASLDHLTGLRSVKQKLGVYEQVVRFNKMRSDKGLPVASTPLHAMFLGSPGTGKTTVAKMMGVMLHRAGMLSKGHVVVRERATLLGQNYNSESEKTLEAIREAQGGILLIDEAYQLYQPNDSRDPGKFVIETLLTALTDENNRDWMLVLAGYPAEMKQMFDMNPGLKSRIPESNIYTFDDFTECELMEIAEKYIARHQYTLAPDARGALAHRLKADYVHREKNFGNARHVINLIQTEILPAMAVRVVLEGACDEASLTEIKPDDIPAPASLPMVSRPYVGFSYQACMGRQTE